MSDQDNYNKTYFETALNILNEIQNKLPENPEDWLDRGWGFLSATFKPNILSLMESIKIRLKNLQNSYTSISSNIKESESGKEYTKALESMITFVERFFDSNGNIKTSVTVTEDLESRIALFLGKIEFMIKHISTIDFQPKMEERQPMSFRKETVGSVKPGQSLLRLSTKRQSGDTETPTRQSKEHLVQVSGPVPSKEHLVQVSEPVIISKGKNYQFFKVVDHTIKAIYNDTRTRYSPMDKYKYKQMLDIINRQDVVDLEPSEKVVYIPNYEHIQKINESLDKSNFNIDRTDKFYDLFKFIEPWDDTSRRIMPLSRIWFLTILDNIPPDEYKAFPDPLKAKIRKIESKYNISPNDKLINKNVRRVLRPIISLLNRLTAASVILMLISIVMYIFAIIVKKDTDIPIWLHVVSAVGNGLFIGTTSCIVFCNIMDKQPIISEGNLIGPMLGYILLVSILVNAYTFERKESAAYKSSGVVLGLITLCYILWKTLKLKLQSCHLYIINDKQID